MSGKLSGGIRKLLAKLPFEHFRNPAPVVAVVNLQGQIAAKGRFGQALNLAGVADALEDAFSLHGVKAVALAINSPGGSPVQSVQIMRRIRALSEEKEVPVYAFAEDVAASGGYLIALAGDEIYADEASIVGSIGVISASFGFPEAMKKLGVERRVYTAGEKKSMLDPFQPENEEDISHIKELQKDIHAYFQSLVKERRGERLKGTQKVMFSGDVWTGTKAVKLGLIDGLGELRATMREKLGEKTRFLVMDQEKGWLRSRLGLGARQNNIATQVLDAMESRMIWSRFGL